MSRVDVRGIRALIASGVCDPLALRVDDLCDRVEALERTLRDLEPVLDSAVSAACAKAPPDYAETADALDAVRNALEGDE